MSNVHHKQQLSVPISLLNTLVTIIDNQQHNVASLLHRIYTNTVNSTKNNCCIFTSQISINNYTM